MHTTRLSALAVALLSLSIVACTDPVNPDPNGETPSSVSDSSQSPTGPITADRTSRESVAAAILESFGRGDWQTLSTFVAPTGVRFTPSTYVNVETDQTFGPGEITGFLSDNTVRVWGSEEGSGFPIEMTNAEYLARYVWDHDYRDATDVRWNHVQDRGSMIDNVQDVYPGASVVEYNFPGFDPQYGGMDWRSLRLVLAQADNGEWKLHGIIHDEWTP